MKKIVSSIFLIALCQFTLIAQCINFKKHPSSNISIVNDGEYHSIASSLITTINNNGINTNGVRSPYSDINDIAIGYELEFLNGTGFQNGYITITNLTDGTVLAHGFSPLVWTPTENDIRVHWSLGTNCNSSFPSDSFFPYNFGYKSKKLTRVPDRYFELLLIGLGYDFNPLNDVNFPVDGYVLTDNINKIKRLGADLGGGVIHDLTGIEDFVALEELDIDFHPNMHYLNLTSNKELRILKIAETNISSIDLSENKKLESLILYSNPLNSLNLRHNKSLKKLWCSENNLTNLDLNKNMNLEHLNCSFNNLASLDVSKNIMLTTLYCDHNNLETLNVRNGNNTNMSFYAMDNPKLTCIQVDDAAYSNANWSTDKDATASYNEKCYTYVPDDNFEQALIDSGYDGGPLDDYVPYANVKNISSLNVNYENISDLTGIEDFIALEKLDCIVNNLASLDISNNINLTTLNCTHNNLKELDVSNNIALLDLDCYANELTSLDLNNNTALEQLGCSINSLTSLDVSNNVNLTTLNCSHNWLKELDVNNNISLETLNCDGNFLTALDFSANSELVFLNCFYNNLESLNVKNGNNTNFTYFNATENPSLICIQVDDTTYSTANWVNKDNIASYSEDCNYPLSVENKETNNFWLYPNPVSNILYIKSNSPVDEISVISIQGAEILKTITPEIDVSAIPSGIYIIKIISGDKTAFKKIIKE